MANLDEALIQRIKEVMRQFGLNQTQMADKTNIRQPNLSAILRGKRTCDEAIINKICISLDISKSWLQTGEGSMLKAADSNAQLVGSAHDAISEATVQVRFFEVSPTATFQEFCYGATETPSSVDIVPFGNEVIDDTYCVFEIHGESMAPQIQPHARVLCQEIPPSRWHTLADCVIVIAYADRFVIKRITANHLAECNYLDLASDNPDYPATERVQLADIRAIFRAKRIISSQIV